MEIRTALVTGAAGGIGGAVVKKLITKGFRVFGVDLNPPSLVDAPGSEGLWHPTAADVRDVSSISDALKDEGPIHAVVANAGICKRARLDDPDADDIWKKVLDINLTGIWNTFRAVREMLSPGAAAVMVSSGLGKLGRPGYSAYTASKHGVLGLLKCLAPELATRGIRLNAVCPGWVDTAMARADLEVTAAEMGISAEDARRDAESGIPLRRFVKPQEVANLICWLLSDEASAITGQSHNISCGELPV